MIVGFGMTWARGTSAGEVGVVAVCDVSRWCYGMDVLHYCAAVAGLVLHQLGEDVPVNLVDGIGLPVKTLKEVLVEVW